MAALMAHMAEQRAIGLVEGLAGLLARDGLGFGEVDGDQAVVVAGLGVGDDVERKRRQAGIGEGFSGSLSLRVW